MDILFSSTALRDVQEQLKGQLRFEIEQLDKHKLLKLSTADLIQSFVVRFSQQLPKIREEKITHDVDEARVDARLDPSGFVGVERGATTRPGSRYTFFVPFDGDSELFWFAPNLYGPTKPVARMETGHLVFIVDTINPDPQQVQNQIDRELRSVQDWLLHMEPEVNRFNAELPGLAQQHIEARRERLLRAAGVASQLRFPLRHRAEKATTFSAPEVRRKPRIELPAVAPDPFRPEPTLATEDFEFIIDVTQRMALVMERSPSAFSAMDEETLRMMFLVQFNGQFEAQASGETFNFQGKTDILIRSGERNVFIAECKFWSGPEKFRATVDQLLGYLSWRDAKAALIMFSTNKDFSAVLGKMRETLESHPNFKRHMDATGRPGHRVVLRHRDDPVREVLVAALAFHIPT
ncbi:hypothetical protein [Corallococcus exiguus]|uniref:hypothetical protein n=1 Tax=Corallococcus exiguus TaxID=83462 RepID=UPI00155F8562|nr:hypothetical protein [Corallococcus exiguus]NRD52823.1 hypothetical protein [Corallococcus exiguus]